MATGKKPAPDNLSPEILQAVEKGDVARFNKCVKKGANVLGLDKNGWNILHHIGYHNKYAFYRSIVLEHTQITTLIHQTANDGSTPLMMSCKPIPPDIRLIDAFVRLGGDLLYRDSHGRSCTDVTSDRNTRNYLSWRRLHTTGLPDAVLEEQSTPKNDVIMQFLRSFTYMDDTFADRFEKELKKKKEKSANIRIIFLGHEGVGKTTLCHWLIGQKVKDGGPGSTDTMEVNLSHLMINKATGEVVFLPEHDVGRTLCHRRLRDMVGNLTLSDMPPQRENNCFIGDMAYVNIFDFGGESLFTNFQHIFLNDDAVFILVFSLHNCLDELAIVDRVYFWLKFIASYSHGKYKPPVILVGTHMDKIPPADRKNTLKFVIDIIRNNPEIDEIYQNHIIEFFHIGNKTQTDSEREIIWKAILKSAPYQAQWGQLLPGSWISLEHDIMRLRNSSTRVMTFKELKERATKFGVVDVEGFLRYMHTSRTILSFPSDDEPGQPIPLDMKIILDPAWMIRAFRLIVTALKFHLQNLEKDDPLLIEYQRTRRLKREFIDRIWRMHDVKEGFLSHSETLLYFIERSELIVKPVPTGIPTDVDTYIVPSLLQPADPDLVRQYLKDKYAKTSSTLCIQFQDKFVPEAVCDKFLASLIYRFKVDDATSLCIQRGIACFLLTGDWKMIAHCRDRMIKITLFSENPSPQPFTNGKQLRGIVTDLLDSTLRRNDQLHLVYKAYLHHNFEVLQEDNVLEPSKVKSMLHSDRTTKLSKADYDFWFTMQPRPKTAGKGANASSGNTSGVDLTREPSLKQMSHIAKHIGDGYVLFFLELGMKNNTITQVRQTNAALDFRSQITRTLIAWRNSRSQSDVTLSAIVDAMNATHMDSAAMMSELSPNSQEAEKIKKSVCDLCLPERRLREVEVDIVARSIGTMYVVFFIHLDLEDEIIREAELNHHGEARNMKMHLLHTWLQRNGKEASVHRIMMASRECDIIGWKELADKLRPK
ncbi:uncharacterized protein LOC110446358 [Mizuhopecten yessoensis]|uniref:Serine/threonine-protein kinase roco5 n=1 Tax=Mizuhopecten yessoensis TaxID=6573 RepID=A0A210QXM2_MIZYE|nr:uncharacterized protein LOC110446358 [Mizuhopecten yessoensis]OWF53442.1 serine/threonine-protein kinase roco5 [Mizuhopecten yessoensis]